MKSFINSIQNYWNSRITKPIIGKIIFIGLGIFKISNTGLKTGTDLFWQISAFVPFISSGIIFGMNLYSKRIKD